MIQRITARAVLLITLLVSATTWAQPCPGFQSGNPANNLYTISFYDASGNFIKNCSCQLTGNAFKCGNCLPSSFALYQYTANGIPLTCINAVFLPVELSAFTATVVNGDVQLSWTTQTERDNAEFVLERSADAIEFVPFSKVPGAGNSLSSLSYSEIDSDPLKGTSYYRIAQRDVNGTVNVLAIVSVELSSAVAGTVLAPNPAQGTTTLQLPLHTEGTVFDVLVTDQAGKQVKVLRLTENAQLELQPGFYQVSVRSGNQVWSEKLIVTN